MVLLFYVRLIVFTAGALLHLLLLALILGHRRPRRFERILFLLVLTLFLFYSGSLLATNAAIHYVAPPAATELFAVVVILLGLAALPPLLVHTEVECAGTIRGGGIPLHLALVIGTFYAPLAYFAWRFIPRLIGGSTIDFLWSDGRASQFYGIWLGLALFAGATLEFRISRADIEADARRFHRILAGCLTLLALLVLSIYGFGFPRDPSSFSVLTTIVISAGLLPGALLGYFTLRYNFLQIGMQRNLVYAVSAAFLALLYLAFVRRLGIWFEPVLPPESTTAILLFILVFLFEPLERVIGRTLYRSFQQRMDRVQRLILELQREAQGGDVENLITAAERRIQEEFSLSSVRIVLPRGSDWSPLRAPGGLGHCVQFPLRKGSDEIGLLEACSTGAFLVGETTVALEFLAEQFPALVAHCRLIEEKLRLERELAERERLALVGQMAASISHNLRNPLSSMKTVLQVLLEDQNLPPRVRKDCELVAQEMDRLGKKLTQLLQFSKPSVRQADSAKKTGVLSVAQQVISVLRHEAERYGIALELHESANEFFVPGPEEAWSDVISNLVVNAIEAQPAGGRVRISFASANSELRIEILDDGPGIPTGEHTRVFQPFFTTKPSGTGLGLAIAARRVAEMGGKIEWESPVRDGRGTRFIVTVPSSSSKISPSSNVTEGKKAS